MSEEQTTAWQYLESRPKSFYRQLFVKGTRITSRALYGWYLSEDEPMTPEQLAGQFNLPLAAVLEAIAYCETDPPEIADDFRREEALMEATGMKDPSYKYAPNPRAISTQERARILGL